MELESGGKVNDEATVPHKNNESQVTCDLKLGFLVKKKGKKRKEIGHAHLMILPLGLHHCSLISLCLVSLVLKVCKFTLSL